MTKVVISGDHADEQNPGPQPGVPAIEALAIDPADSKSLFAVTGSRRWAGCIESKDGAKTWQMVGDLAPGGRAIYIDPDSPKNNRTVYIAGANSVSVLENGALRRQPGPEGVRQFLDIQAGFSGEGKKPVFYAVSGVDWHGRRNPGHGAVYICRRRGGLAEHSNRFSLERAQGNGAPGASRDWNQSQPSANCVSLVPRSHQRAYGERAKPGCREDCGHGKPGRWYGVTPKQPRPRTSTIPGSPRGMAPIGERTRLPSASPPVNPDLCFGTDFGRTMRTRDGGKTWQGVYAHRLGADGGTTTTGLDVLTTNGIIFDPFDPDRWFVAFADLGLFESRKSGEWWKESDQPAAFRPSGKTAAYWAVFDPDVRGASGPWWADS